MDLSPQRFNVLSLCSGCGGLDLGLKLAVPDARTVCYVENEAYACEVLASRMEDKALDDAPLWTDLRTFAGKPWRGAVDTIIGGYPCQPFSVAGRQRGINDRRHLWPDIARLIREIDPEWCFFENVANHLNIGYREVRRELEEMGYHVAEGLFTAAEVGAPHKRQRLFILAHSLRKRSPPNWPGAAHLRSRAQFSTCPSSADVANAFQIGRGGEQDPTRGNHGDGHPARRQEGPDWPEQRDPDVEYPESQRTGQGSMPQRTSQTVAVAASRSSNLADTQCSGPQGQPGSGVSGEGRACIVSSSQRSTLAHGNHSRLERRSLPGSQCADQWPTGKSGRPLFPPGPADGDGWREFLAIYPEAQPSVRNPVDGATAGVGRRRPSNRVDELRLLGNGVVPQCAALAFLTLLDQLEREENN